MSSKNVYIENAPVREVKELPFSVDPNDVGLKQQLINARNIARGEGLNLKTAVNNTNSADGCQKLRRRK